MNIFINLSVIFWSLFPALMSYTQPASTPLKVELIQLVANSDLLIPKASPNENVPLGFQYKERPTDITLTNGIATFTATAQFGRIQYDLTYPDSSLIYYFASVKTSSLNVSVSNNYASSSYHSGNNVYQLLSFVYKNNPATQPFKVASVRDVTTSGFVPIEVDYMGAINITDLVSRGMLPSGLTDNEYKSLIDSIINEIGGTFDGSYFYTETISDNYKWFSTGFVEKTGERDFIDYLGFFVWLVVPYLFAYLIYKLLKGVLHG